MIHVGTYVQKCMDERRGLHIIMYAWFGGEGIGVTLTSSHQHVLITATLNRLRNTQSSDSLLYHLSPLQITLHCLDEMQRSGNRKLRSAEVGVQETLISIFFILCIVHFTANYVDILLSVICSGKEISGSLMHWCNSSPKWLGQQVLSHLYYGGRNCRNKVWEQYTTVHKGRCASWAGVRNERFAHCTVFGNI